MSDKKKLNFGPLFIAFAALLWTTDVFVRGNLEGKLTSVQITFLDHILIVLVISPLVIKFLPKLKSFTLKEWVALGWIGIGGSALATIFLTEGFFVGDFPYQFAGIVVLMQQTQPIFAIGLATVVLKEKLPKLYYLYSLVSIIGVLMIISPLLGSGGLSDFGSSYGLSAAFFGMMAALLWGTSTVFGRYLLEHGSEKREYIQITTYRFTMALVFLLAFVPLYSKSGGYPVVSNLLSTEIALSILYLAFIVGLLSLVLYYYGLKTTHASVSAIFELAFPLSYYILVPNILPLINPDAWVTRPLPIQYLGGIILMISSTILSYKYGKLNIKMNENNSPIPS